MGKKSYYHFSKTQQHIVESLASQAAVAISNQMLIQSLNDVFEGFVKSIANAIDAQSPFTANHCSRVPVISDMLAHAVSKFNEGKYAHKKFTDAEYYELNIAALMHDCGKVTTPIHIIEKETRLQTIFDRIELIQTRFDLLKAQRKSDFLEECIEKLEGGQTDTSKLQIAHKEELEKIGDAKEFIIECNENFTFMDEERCARVKEIAKWPWIGLNGQKTSFLSEDEVTNLCISRGTLTSDEREIINDHVSQTIKMLEHLPFPKHLENVSEIAGRHHERMDGKGYPSGCVGSEMSTQARILAIADVFEALTSPDRPYKSPLLLSTSIKILKNMAEEGHVDPDLLTIFIKENVFLDYAKEHLAKEQIDVEKALVES